MQLYLVWLHPPGLNIYVPSGLSYSKISKNSGRKKQQQGRTPTLKIWVGEIFSSLSQNSSVFFPGLTFELLFLFSFYGVIYFLILCRPPCMNCRYFPSSSFFFFKFNLILIHHSLSFDLQAFIHYALSSVRSYPSCISH
jgi:hypothetical protein